MILEISNFVDSKTISEIKNDVKPFIPKEKKPVYNRQGSTVCISDNNRLKNLDDKLYKIFLNVQNEIVQDKYKPQYNSGDSGYEYHIYYPNDVCNYHFDGEIASSLLRYASVVLHLNTVHEGGELIFPNQNKKIKTEEGKLVIFPPNGMFPHYTTPSNETREIIVTWFVYNDINCIERSV